MVAQMKLSRIWRKMRRERSRAATTSSKSDFMRTISAASIAMSVPVQRAIPTSATASAGESLMPSPTCFKGGQLQVRELEKADHSP